MSPVFRYPTRNYFWMTRKGDFYLETILWELKRIKIWSILEVGKVWSLVLWKKLKSRMFQGMNYAWERKIIWKESNNHQLAWLSNGASSLIADFSKLEQPWSTQGAYPWEVTEAVYRNFLTILHSLWPETLTTIILGFSLRMLLLRINLKAN